MYFYNDGMKLCDGCAGDSDRLYGDYVPLPKEEADEIFCDICGGNDWVEGDDE